MPAFDLIVTQVLQSSKFSNAKAAVVFPFVENSIFKTQADLQVKCSFFLVGDGKYNSLPFGRMTQWMVPLEALCVWSATLQTWHTLERIDTVPLVSVMVCLQPGRGRGRFPAHHPSQWFTWEMWASLLHNFCLWWMRVPSSQRGIRLCEKLWYGVPLKLTLMPPPILCSSYL